MPRAFSLAPCTLALAALAALHATAPTPATAATLTQAPGPDAIAAPEDKAWPGTLELAVDATDLDHRVLQVRERLPVAGPGKLTLLYPRWLPGTHGPTGTVSSLAGLQIRADGPTGQPLAWQRDTVDPYAFHVEVPRGVQALDLQFQHLSPLKPQDGRVSMTPAIVGVQWNQALLYPAGHYASAIRVQAKLRLPAGWQAATALRAPGGALAQADAQGWFSFAPQSLEAVIDSPVFAGRYARRIELDAPGTARPVALNLVADEPEQLEATPAQIDAHRALVQQATKVFASRNWRQYDFLLSQSKEFSGIGLEHQESSENGVRPGYFKDWDKATGARELLPHEFTHSWNGKYRRPADLWTPNYNVPMRDSLLWLYEGQTQFWGHVLAARSGLTTLAQARHTLASIAASNELRSGRAWRSLQDTTNEGVINSGRDKAWRDWQRGVDYYDEGLLVWLDTDTLIREQSGDKRSIDDFAAAFFGVPHAEQADGVVLPRPYTFEDITQTLASVQKHDWARFLRQRLDATGGPAPLDGLARSGWKLVYTDKESEFAKAGDGRGRERSQDLSYSLGVRVGSEGKLEAVLWNSPAFQAGLAPEQVIVAVGGMAYTPERLAAAITANQGGTAPIELLTKRGDQYRTVTIDWRGGLRYPALERIPGTPDRLSALYAPRR